MGDPLILNGKRLPIKYEDFSEKIINPFYDLKMSQYPIEEQLIRIFDNNLSFAVYNLFKWKGEPLKLAPFQAVILQMLWEKTFPMMLLSRGAGKCVKDALILTNKGIFELNDSYVNDKRLYGETGFRKPIKSYSVPKEDIIKITTKFGYEISGTNDHPIRIIDACGNIIWKELGKLDKTDVVIINRCEDYLFHGKYNLSRDIGYLWGAIIGDGCITKSAGPKIGFTNFDLDIVNEVERCSKLLWPTAKFSKLKKDGAYSITFGSAKNHQECLDYFKVKKCLSKDKEIPTSILESNKNVLASFLSGLFDTDGGTTKRGIEYSTMSAKLAKQVHVLLLTFGIIAKLRQKKVKYNGDIRYTNIISLTGDALKLFNNLIGFRCARKAASLNNLLKIKSNTNHDTFKNIEKKLLSLYGIAKFNNYKHIDNNLMPSRIKSYNYSYPKIRHILDSFKNKECNEFLELAQLVSKNYFYDTINKIEKLPADETFDVTFGGDDHSFFTNGFISHNSFMLGLYSLARAIMVPGTKVVIVAASFRQSKLVFDYARQIYNYSPLAQQCVTKLSPNNDMHIMEINHGMSTIIALPLGDGERIRGIRATDILVDEISSVPEEVLNVVVRGFASVSSDPIRNAEIIHAEDTLVKKGQLDPKSIKRRLGNKIILSGTAHYQFNHSFKTYKLYRAILENKYIGDSKKLQTDTTSEEESMLVDYRDYALLQIPYTAIPKGFMDEKQIAQAKASMPKAQFQMEYECQFPTDSDGFFKRSAINEATPGISKSCSLAPFNIELSGEAGFSYAMGIDPARKSDNFAISIIKLLPDGKFKNVYCWAFNNKSFIECVRKIRDLLRKFNVVRIAMDAGGGGNAIMDLLQSAENAGPQDLPIWQFDDKDQMMLNGLHILDMVNFVPTWIANANYGMAADIEHQRLLFPSRGHNNVVGDEQEEVWDNIAEQINETCMIVVTPTKTGVQHFDLPDTNIPGVQNTQRKDRYSALLLSTYAARSYLTEQTISNIDIAIGDWIEALP